MVVAVIPIRSYGVHAGSLYRSAGRFGGYRMDYADRQDRLGWGMPA
jgi:hypothetical protein